MVIFAILAFWSLSLGRKVYPCGLNSINALIINNPDLKAGVYKMEID